MGSIRAWAEFLQVGLPMQHFRDMAERVLPTYPFEKPMAPTFGGGTFGSSLAQGVVRREPYGVAALVSAYNAPTLLNLVKLAPALAAGCTVVLKPAPATPLETFVLGEVADAAGLPPGVLNIVTGDIAAGQALTSHPGVDVVSFTGSDAVGRLVYSQAAPTLKKVILELGGKSANIILPGADLSRAVPNVVVNMTAQAGQGCSLLTRTLVHESLFDDVVGQVKAALDAVKVGDPADPATTMGPLISAAQRAKVEGLIQAGRDEGAQIAYGGGRPAGLDRGFFVEPTLFVDVDNSMTIAQKEFFGPVGVVIPFKDERGGGPPRQRQRVRPGGRRVGGRPGARLPDRHPHQGRPDLHQRRRGRLQPAHPVRRLQEQRPRGRARRVRPRGVPARQEHDLECPLSESAARRQRARG